MKSSQPELMRRHMFTGAGTVGALAAVAALLPGKAKVTQVAPAPQPAESTSAGYQETPHVLRYYETTRV